MKIELKHLAGYLPYGLKTINNDNSEIMQLGGLSGDTAELLQIKGLGTEEEYCRLSGFDEFKPILRPLSDLTNEDTIAIHGLGSIELELINIEEWTEELINEIQTGQKFKLSQFEYLYSKHFDIHGLIPQNLAIDKNTL